MTVSPTCSSQRVVLLTSEKNEVNEELLNSASSFSFAFFCVFFFVYHFPWNRIGVTALYGSSFLGRFLEKNLALPFSFTPLFQISLYDFAMDRSVNQ